MRNQTKKKEDSKTRKRREAEARQALSKKRKDKKENINTLPVLYGEKNAIAISHASIFLSMLIFYFNNNFYNNIYVSGLFEIQNFGNFFLTFNNTKT